jgi:ATPase subunit of ABC transporter with duplicated ATPase domains
MSQAAKREDPVPGSLAAFEITKSYGAVTVLERLSLRVGPRDRVGIVGPNGIGKTTLLRILAGLDAPDAGRVVRPGAVGYLPQEPDARPGESLALYFARRTGVAAAEAETDALAARLHGEPQLAQAYADALDRFLALGGDDFAARARAVALEVRLGRRLDRPVASMSGGEAARAALGAILLARFDVFLLDEPTNNLDFEGLDRLERFLDGLDAGVVLVSHDRAFLDRTVNRIVEIEAETRRVREFSGTWSDYEHTRGLARAKQQRDYARYVEERDRFAALLADRRSQARAGGGTLAKASGGADRRGTHALMTKVRQAEKRLERLEKVDKPWSPWRLQLSLPSGSRAGDVVAELHGALIRRNGFHLGPIDLELRWGDRLAILGRNGAGKTTLLRALVGELPLERGSRRVGSSARIGELDQSRETFSSPAPLLDVFLAATELPPVGARTLLAKFALGAEDVVRPANSLSPGERTRTSLAMLAARGVNCLVLDEPTNHLDLEAIAELETALDEYDGTLVVVTHDRRFLERLAVTRTLEL